MKTYTLVIKAQSIVCVEGRESKARRFMRADGLEIWVLGTVGKRRDTAINIALNKAIECGYRAREVMWW